jgi:hypothetical protein
MKTICFLLLCLPLTVFAQLNKGMIYADDFESYPVNYGYIDSNNSWYIGHPSKAVFDSAHTGNIAIFTDTSYYRVNDSSSFTILVIPDRICQGALSFWHKINSAAGCDGGYIEVRFNEDTVWHNLVHDSTGQLQYGNYLYAATDTIKGGIPAFSGSTSHWVNTWFEWNWWIPVKGNPFFADSLLIKFTFKSDSIPDNMDGWIIDDIEFNIANWGSCSSIEEYGLSDDMLAVYPNPACSEITIDNKNTLNLASAEILNTLGQTVLMQTLGAERKTHINISGLPDGLYLLTVSDVNGNRLVKRIMKRR